MSFERFKDEQHNEWARLVKQRDNYYCQNCYNVHSLHSHHVLNYSEHLDLRYEISNGITLCGSIFGEDGKIIRKGCHDFFHEIYGKTNNNRIQLKEFFIICRIIKNKLT